jgi:hypothetical protein
MIGNIVGRFVNNGADPYPLTPGEFADLVKRDLALEAISSSARA